MARDILYEPESEDILSYKYPRDSFRSGDKLVVMETQGATLFHQGNFLASLDYGSYELEPGGAATEGGEFSLEIYFISRKPFGDIAWNTSGHIDMSRIGLGFVPVRAMGNLAAGVGDAEKFIRRFSLGRDQFIMGELIPLFEGFIRKELDRLLGENFREYLKDPDDQTQLTADLMEELGREFSDKGIEIAALTIDFVAFSREDLEKLIKAGVIKGTIPTGAPVKEKHFFRKGEAMVGRAPIHHGPAPPPPVATGPQDQDKRPPEEAMASIINCPGCMTYIKIDCRTCPNCQKMILTRKCPRCQNVILLASKECTHCGVAC